MHHPGVLAIDVACVTGMEEELAVIYVEASRVIQAALTQLDASDSDTDNANALAADLAQP
ncbi:MAG: hypothetical protein IIC62_00455 [Proteobacteria bacterium]|nr:hypothetical protein [Pseudomonadota bacterium]